MNVKIDDLTLGQIKEINRLFPPLPASNENKDILAYLIGQNVLIRDDKAGLFITTLVAIRGSEWVGGKSRKIHYWKGAGAIEGIAETGIDLDGSRITVATKESNGKHLVQVCPVHDSIYMLLMGAKEWNPK